MKKEIFFLTNIAPHYRTLLWKKMLTNENYKFQFYFGKENISGIKEIDLKSEEFVEHKRKLHQVKNFYLRKRVLIWQKGVIMECLNTKAETAIITGDSWVLSNWIAALIFRLKGVDLVFWGHGLYGNEKKFKKLIRKNFFKLAKKHLLYEKNAKKIMIANGFAKDKLHIVFNSLDYEKNLTYRKKSQYLSKNNIFNFFENPKLPTIFFVGRLTQIKKINYLIDSIRILKEQDLMVNLLIIGDGNQKEKLTKQVSELKIENQCYFYGACYSEEILAKLIATSDLCVSPGNVGLTAIHSLSYGTPVLTHNNYLHQMPEVESITEGKNGCFFKQNDLESMVEQIKLWLFDNKLTRNEIRNNCYEVIDKYYNPDYQISVIENLIDNNPPLI